MTDKGLKYIADGLCWIAFAIWLNGWINDNKVTVEIDRSVIEAIASDGRVAK